ncbi:MAG TPA: preprotein translocase subunit SecY [Alloprevotella sp.]|uniref:preprotein translocase subunit SecY n=2 Tax=Bacteroidia TaxID=200643 RepID=UPI0025B6B57A|nr:preprotein translocase subunit SecY [uncultured Duncaniella sp.]HRF85872.1 preprotein translocase subunit SecY [Alloprevotella sp.]
MKKIIETIKNIWRIEDLKTRILITLLFVAIYRFGSFVVLPGIDPGRLQQLQEQTSEGLMSLLNMFSGGAFSNASIFALGIMPYISASIVIQLLAVAVPYFQKMQREGESGRRKINQYTRWLTIAILLFQAPTYLINLKGQTAGSGAFLVGDGFWFMFSSTIILAAGSMFILWLGERITDKGIGNGISIIIMVGIIARMPSAIVEELTSALTAAEGGGLIKFLFEIIALLAVMALAIMLVKATRRVPVQYAKRIEGNRQLGGARQYIPLKLFAANVMPIIFAQAIMFIPLTLAQAVGESSTWALSQFLDHTSVLYNLVFVFLIVVFTYFYTAITLNPVQMAEDMKRNNGFIPGVKPGKSTADYLDNVMSHITLPGSLFIALIAIMPAFAGLFGVKQGFAQFFGGTSLLILVGVVLDTLQQIESHMLVRHYDGLLNSGHVRTRSGGMAAY